MKYDGQKLAKEIEIENVGKLNEFIGCKINIDIRAIGKIYPTCHDSVIFGQIQHSKKEASDTSGTEHSSKNART